MVMDIVLGVIGAVVGGYLATLVGYGEVTGLNIYIAVVGAIVVLLVYRAVASRA